MWVQSSLPGGWLSSVETMSLHPSQPLLTSLYSGDIFAQVSCSIRPPSSSRSLVGLSSFLLVPSPKTPSSRSVVGRLLAEVVLPQELHRLP